MKLKVTDGGRSEAGYTGKARDCVVRAIAIVTQKPYQEVYNAIFSLAQLERIGKCKQCISSPRNGVLKPTYRKYLEHLGYQWTPTMFIGQGCKVHLRKEELPSGRLVVEVSRHVVAVINGVIHDENDCSRGGNRCVYGYYFKE